MNFPEGFLWGGTLVADQDKDVSDIEKDIAPLAQIGIDCLRIPLSRALIFPNGEDEPDGKGLKFYDKIFDCCKKYGIEPIVTISYCEMPYDQNGADKEWEDRQCIESYERYAKVLFEHYKDKVKLWLIPIEVSCSKDEQYPAMRQDEYQALHNELVAAARVVRYAHMHFPDFLMGNMTEFVPVYPAGSGTEDLRAAQEKMQMTNWFCSDILVRGEYPYYVKRCFKEHGIKIKMDPVDLDDLSEGTVDFYTLSCDKGLRWSLNEIYGRYGIPVMVVENATGEGLGDELCMDADEQIDLLSHHISEMSEALEDGVDMMGYATGKDMDEDSLEWYKKVISSNGELPDFW